MMNSSVRHRVQTVLVTSRIVHARAPTRAGGVAPRMGR